jgi:hypothetical protein
MTTLVLRVGVGSRPGKGSPLTALELDTNFTNLDASIATKLTTPAGVDGQILRYGTSWEGTNLLRVLDTGKVGIGITTPLTQLDVHDTSVAAYTAPDDTTVARFARDAGVSLEMLSESSATISFGDVASNNVGRIAYQHSDNSMKMWTAGTERMVINSSGFVGIGVADPLTSLHVDGELRLTTTGKLRFSDFVSIANASGLTSHVNLHSNKYGFGVTEATVGDVTTGALELCSHRDFKFSSNQNLAATLTADGHLTTEGSIIIKAPQSVGTSYFEVYGREGSAAPVFEITDIFGLVDAAVWKVTQQSNYSSSWVPLNGSFTITGPKIYIDSTRITTYSGGENADDPLVPSTQITSATGDITAVTFTGSGANLTNLPNSLPSATVNQTMRYSGTTFEPTSSLVIKSDGNVGIGIADPQYKLQVSGGYIVNFGSGDSPGNTTFGDGALGTVNTGGANTAIGHETLLSNTIGQSNTALGSRALKSNITGKNSIAIGQNAMRDTTGIIDAVSASDVRCIAIGNDALMNNTTGVDNIAIGILALEKNLTGISSLAMGYQALRYSTGGHNTSIGSQSSSSTTTGMYNTAVGEGALKLNITSDHNVALGREALTNVVGVNGDGNNIAIGSRAGSAIVAGQNNVIIGTNVLGSASLSDTVIIAAGNAERIRILDSGNMGIGTSVPTEMLEVNGKVKATSFVGSGAELTGIPVQIGAGSVNQLLRSDGTNWVPTSAIVIQSGGTVGIGVDPVYSLDVQRPAAAGCVVNIQSQADGTNVLLFDGLLTNSIAEISGTMNYGSTGNTVFKTGSGADFLERMRISSVGKVSIGAFDPDYDLDIQNDNIPQINIESKTSGNESKLSFGSGSYLARILTELTMRGESSISLQTNSLQRVFISSTGDVGIGNGTPLAKLDVTGNVLVNSDAFIRSDGTWLAGTSAADSPNETHGFIRSSTTSDRLVMRGPYLDFQHSDGTSVMYIDASGNANISGATTFGTTVGITGDLTASAAVDITGDLTARGSSLVVNSTSVGIGTASPSASHKLDVGGNIIVGRVGFGVSTEGAEINLRSADGSSSWVMDIRGDDRTAATADFRIFNNLETSGDMIIGYLNADQSAGGASGYSTGSIIFQTGNRQRIKTEGNGTTTLFADDTATDITGTNRAVIQAVASATAPRDAPLAAFRDGGPYAALFGADGVGTGQIERLNTNGGVNVFGDMLINSGKLTIKTPLQNIGTPSTNHPASLVLWTKSNSTTAAAMAAQFMSNDGESAAGGILTKVGQMPVFSSLSDERLKENILSVDPASSMAKIEAVRVVDFDLYPHIFNRDTTLPLSTGQRGVIAQEYQDNYPEGVTRSDETDPDSLLSVGNVHEWDLLNAVKYLKAEIDSLKEEVKFLKGQ